MEQLLTWYRIFLKRYMHRWTYYFQLLLFIVILITINHIRLPQKKDLTVYIYNDGTEIGNKIIRDLKSADSIFSFVSADNKDMLEKAVKSGSADCGFEIGSEADESMAVGKCKGIVTYVSSVFTSKGSIAKETFFAAFFKEYSEQILQNEQNAIFGVDDEDIRESLIQRNRQYLAGDDVFRVDYHTEGKRAVSVANEDQMQPLRGTAAILIFMLLLFVKGEEIAAGSREPAMYFSGITRMKFRLGRYMAAVTLPFIAVFILLMHGRDLRYAFPEFVCLAVFVLLCMIWCESFAALTGKKIYSAGFLSVLLVTIVMCPVFFDAGEFVPALRYVSYLLPPALYMHVVPAVLQWLFA